MLVSERLDITQQCALTAQNVKCILGCIQSSMANRLKEVNLHFYSAHVDLTWSKASSSSIPNVRTWIYWSVSGRHTDIDQRDGAPLL